MKTYLPKKPTEFISLEKNGKSCRNCKNNYTCEEILSNINFIYDEVFVSYKTGCLSVYNPRLFSNLTKDTFAEWVLHCNKNLVLKEELETDSEMDVESEFI